MNNTSCPLCGQSNSCEAERSDAVSDCWCFHLPIPAELRSRIPDAHRGACICQNCVQQYWNNKE
ncbi:cysteine-rich CWC family protein [Paenibacillus sp. PL2-23]|uniref:cysteine-rich CWC family protein n=1 Tax=Paenibacillus sp. PL2-23 TaxID=2100729 RepID=UPI00349EE5E0